MRSGTRLFGCCAPTLFCAGRASCLHQTPIRAQPPHRAAVEPPSRRSRPRNSFVPSCRPTQFDGLSAVAAGDSFVAGSGEGQSSKACRGEAPRWRRERERASNHFGGLPGLCPRPADVLDGIELHAANWSRLARALDAPVRRLAHPLCSRNQARAKRFRSKG